MMIVKGLLLVIQAAISISLVLLVMSQTSKNEGFGTIGVQTPTSFKALPGHEERMQALTRGLAIGWFVTGVVISIIYAHSGSGL
jgi:protein translocase SecG subunit